MLEEARGEGDGVEGAEKITHPRPSSLPVRTVEVFFTPGKLFESLRDNPAWFGALLVGGALTVVSMLLIPQELWVSAAREQLIQRGQEVPPGLAATAGIMRMAALVGGSLFWFVWAFLLAGILTLVFAFVLGDRGRYAQYLSVVSHALLIGAVGGLLMVPLRILQQDPSLNLSVGTFALFLQEGYAFRVLKLLDLFGLWGYGVMAVGVTKVDPQRGLGSALFFFYAFALAFALLFGIFGG